MTAITFELKKPFEYKGAKYDTVSARRPKVKDVRNFIKNMERDSSTAVEKALVDLTELDDAVIAEIDIEDYAPMKKWFESFLKQLMDDSTN